MSRRPAQSRLGEIRAVSLAELRAAQPEAAFQAGVVQFAKVFGWAVLWVRPVRISRKQRDGTEAIRYETPFGGDGKGWPDLTLVREVTLYRELKAKTDLRPAQIEWRDRLLAAGNSWEEWSTTTPQDYMDRQLSHRWARGYPPRMLPCGNRFCCPESGKETKQ